MSPIQASKFLSLILRHRPETVGIALDPEGWADVDALLAGMAGKGTRRHRFAILIANAVNQMPYLPPIPLT